MLLPRNRFFRLIIAGLLSINIYSLFTLFRNRKRFKNVLMANFRGYSSLSGLAGWKSLHLNQLFPEIEDLNTIKINQNLDDVVADIPPDPRWIMYLALITRTLNPSNIFEIGTYKGRATLCMAMNSSENTNIYTLDLPPKDLHRADHTLKPDQIMITELEKKPDEVGRIYKNSNFKTKITQLLDDSMKFDFSTYFNKMDLVLVDGAHDYEHVFSDAQNAINMLKDGGVIIFDDFGHINYNYDVVRALHKVGILNKGFQIEDTQFFAFRKK